MKEGERERRRVGRWVSGWVGVKGMGVGRREGENKGKQERVGRTEEKRDKEYIHRHSHNIIAA